MLKLISILFLFCWLVYVLLQGYVVVFLISAIIVIVFFIIKKEYRAFSLLCLLLSLPFIILNKIDAFLPVKLGEFYIPTTIWIEFIAITVFLITRYLQPVEKNLNQRLKKNLLLFVVFVIVAVSQIFLFPFRGTIDIGNVVPLIVYILPITLVFVIPRSGGLDKRKTEKLISLFIYLVVVSAAIFIVFGIFSNLFISVLGGEAIPLGTESIARGRLPLGHPITVGGVFLISLPLLSYYYKNSQSGIRKLFYKASFVLVSVGIIFTLSRTIFAVYLIYMVYLFGLGTFRKNPKKSVFAVILLLAIILVLFKEFDFSRLLGRDTEGSNEVRYSSLLVSGALFVQNPVWGTSINGFYKRLELIEEDPYDFVVSVNGGGPALFNNGELTAVDPHSLFLMTLVEFGLIGLILFSMFLFYLYKTFSKYLYGKPFREAIILTLLQSLTNSDLIIHFRFLIIFWSLLGIGLNYISIYSSEELGGT